PGSPGCQLANGAARSIRDELALEFYGCARDSGGGSRRCADFSRGPDQPWNSARDGSAVSVALSGAPADAETRGDSESRSAPPAGIVAVDAMAFARRYRRAARSSSAF